MNNYPSSELTHELHCQAPGCQHKDSALAASLLPDGIIEPVARRATAGTDLCNWHHDQFPKVLGDLVELHGLLTVASYTKGAPPAATNDKIASSEIHDAGGYWNPHAATVLAELNDWIGYLVHIIILEHPLPAGAQHAIDGNVKTMGNPGLQRRYQLAAIRRWYASWLSAYPFVGPYLLADALTHRRIGLRALAAPPVKKLQLRSATCQEYIEDDELGPLLCGAPLFAILRPDDEPKPSEVLCSTNPRHTQLPRNRWMEFMDAATATG